MTIYAILLEGEENALYQSDLANMLHMSRRAVRRAIHNERLAGYPICASDSGYFLPATKQDLDRCARTMRKRAREENRIAAALERAAKARAGEEEP